MHTHFVNEMIISSKKLSRRSLGKLNRKSFIFISSHQLAEENLQSVCVSAEDLLTTRGSSCLVWWPQWTLSASWHPPQATAVGHLSQHTRPHRRGHLHRGQPVGQDQISIQKSMWNSPHIWHVRSWNQLYNYVNFFLYTFREIQNESVTSCSGTKRQNWLFTVGKIGKIGQWWNGLFSHWQHSYIVTATLPV